MSGTRLSTRLDEIETRLDIVSAAVAELLRVQTVHVPGRKRRRIKLTPGQKRVFEIERAHRMRMGKVAKRLGLSLEEFERRYPGLDRLPDL